MCRLTQNILEKSYNQAMTYHNKQNKKSHRPLNTYAQKKRNNKLKYKGTIETIKERPSHLSQNR